MGGFPDFLEDCGDRPPLSIEIGDRERNALTPFIDSDDEKVAGPSFSSDLPRLDLEEYNDVGECFLVQDSIDGRLLSRTSIFFLDKSRRYSV